jgi:hypothetical protein
MRRPTEWKNGINCVCRSSRQALKNEQSSQKALGSCEEANRAGSAAFIRRVLKGAIPTERLVAELARAASRYSPQSAAPKHFRRRSPGVSSSKWNIRERQAAAVADYKAGGLLLDRPGAVYLFRHCCDQGEMSQISCYDKFFNNIDQRRRAQKNPGRRCPGLTKLGTLIGLLLHLWLGVT